MLLFPHCKSLGFNYLQIDCFTVLHKIILVMMKCHWGGCSDGAFEEAENIRYHIVSLMAARAVIPVG